ncbi:glycosyltransferase family 39 protein [Trichocoleus sp. FACHB-262]|uniref:ArnT family glycosyltransferase n=1 Tax=Trichocoleus sp. FACHB-262 TaxID=2692869 RepID=UPI00168398DC|nr:glycosyltransferase family 39 protein [Trichocoleus sp. FACHB-262]MBD2123873.1 glycosyltransferase family 39 protein [Trichocoleus sp. FACHB-262]
MKLSVGRRIADLLKRDEKQGSALIWALAIAWLLLIGWIAFFGHLGSIGLIDETEPLFVEAARQMTVTGDWITPFFNEVPRFDKPPLIYWLMAIAFKAFGVNEWAARLPSALAGFALSCFCFYTLRQFGWHHRFSKSKAQELPDCSLEFSTAPKQTSDVGREWQLWLTAGLGGTMVALHPYTFFFGRTGYSDMLLSLCMSGSLLAFFLGYAHTENSKVQIRWYLTFYVLIGLAVLTKGPVGAVLPGMIVTAFLLYVGHFKAVLREVRLGWGALIVLGLSVPWFVLVILANGQAYIDSFFGYHNVERFTSVVNQHSGPWYFHFLIVLVGFLPWSVFLPAAIARLQFWQRRAWQQQPRSTHLGLFAGVWFAVVLGFFTIAATKYFSYVLPSMPAAAILVALWWSEQIAQAEIGQQQSRSLKLSTIAGIALFALLAAACFYSPNWLSDDPTMPNLGLRMEQAGLANWGAIIWGISAIAGLLLLLKRQAQWFWGVSLIGFAAFLLWFVTPMSFLVDAERQLPLREMAAAAVQAEKPQEPLLMIVRGFHKPSLVFYTERPVNFLMNPETAAPEIQQAIAQSTAPGSALVITSQRALIRSGLQPTQYQAIAQSGIYQLIRVPKTGQP